MHTITDVLNPRPEFCLLNSLGTPESSLTSQPESFKFGDVFPIWSKEAETLHSSPARGPVPSRSKQLRAPSTSTQKSRIGKLRTDARTHFSPAESSPSLGGIYSAQ